MKKGLLSALLLLVGVVAFGQTLKNQSWSDTTQVAGSSQALYSVTETGSHYIAAGIDFTNGTSILDTVSVDSTNAGGDLINGDFSTAFDGAYFVGAAAGGTQLYVAGLLDTTSGADTAALYFVKYDAATLAPLDTFIYSATHLYAGMFGGAVVTSDDGLAAVVNYLSGSGSLRMLVTKFAADGTVEFALEDSLAAGPNEEAHGIMEAINGSDLIVYGTADTTAGGTNRQAFWARIDTAAGGSIENFYMFGSPSNTEMFEDAIITADNNYLFAGGQDAATDNLYIVKTGTNGASIFSQTRNQSGNDEWAYGLAEQADGRIVLAGKAGSAAVLDIATSAGLNVFTKTFAGSGSESSFNDLLQTADGGLLAVGFDVDGADSNNFWAYYQFLDLVLDSSFNPTCADSATGQAYFSVVGGTAPYTYTYNGTPVGGIDSTALAAGTYSVVVMDADGQTDTVEFTLTDPDAVVVDSLVQMAENDCYGESLASFRVYASGGSGQFKYAIDGGPFTADSIFTGLAAGTYYVSVLDSVNGCQLDSIDNITITEPDSLFLTADSTLDASCNGNADGYISVVPTGGTGAITYHWDSLGAGWAIAADSIFENLAAGTYRFVAEDANMCSFDTLDVVIAEPSTVNINVTTSTDVTCNGGANGAVATSISGGTAPYTYLWRDINTGDTLAGETASSISGLSAGDYRVYATDDNGCIDSADASITEPTAIVAVQDSIFNVSCYGDTNGRVYYSVSGGTVSGSGYALTIVDTTSGDTTAIEADATELADTLYAGVFFFNVEDDNGCTVQDTFTITQPDTFQLSLIDTNISCYNATDGKIYPTVTGGTAPYVYSWTDTSGTFTSADDTIMNLDASRYILTVTDANGCTVVDSADISMPDTLAVSGVVTHATGCTGSTNGEIDVTVSGGTPGVSGYNFAWTGPNGFTATTEDITNLEAGSYTLVVTDSTSCDSTIMFTVNDGSTAVVSVDSIYDPTCFGDSDGEAHITITGGNAPFVYQWTKIGGGVVSTDSTLTGVDAGTYALRVTDQVGCISRDTAIITDRPELLITNLDSTANLCAGDTLASISMTVAGGTPWTVGEPYTYTWTSMSGFVVEDSLNPDSLIADTYYITVTDSLGCTAMDTIVVEDPAAIAIAVDSVYNVSCNGDSTGGIDLTVTGGTPGLAFAWWNQTTPADTIVTTEDISGMPAGDFVIGVTDTNGCQTMDTITISEQTTLTASTVIDSVSCNGGVDGELTATPAGGLAPYSYSWSNGSDSNKAVNLAAGTYYLTVTDSLACTFMDTLVVPEPTAITSSGVVTNVTGCNGGFNGEIDLTVSGGTPSIVTSYDYSWTGPNAFTSSSEDLTLLYAGEYIVEISDSLGCIVLDTFVVTEPDNYSATVGVVTDALCNGDSTGMVDITLSGGTAPYTYAWWNNTVPGDTIASTVDLSNVPAGTYTFAVEDFYGCDTTIEFTIAEPTALAVSLDSTVVLCNGDNTGSITATISGGTPNYTSYWSGPSAYADTQMTASYTLTDLEAGMYYVTIVDDTSCVLMDSIEVIEPAAPLAASTVVTNVSSCPGAATGSIDLTVTGGALNYSYSWAGPAMFTASTEDISGLVAGTYIYTVTDTNGCVVSDSAVVVNDVAPIVVNIQDTVHILCNGDSTGSAKGVVTGGNAPYSYYWIYTATGDTVGVDSVLAGVPAGDYVLSIQDSLGCDGGTHPLTLTEPAALASSGIVSNVSCNGGADGSIDLTVTGGVAPYTYAWNGGAVSEDTSGLDAGMYTVMITDANGCTLGDTFTVTEPAVLVASIVSVDSVSCNGGADGAIDATVTGGTAPYTYAWDNGDTTEDISGLTAGSYQLIVTDANGCVDTVVTTVDEPAVLNIDALIGSNLSCNGANDGAVNSTVSGGTGSYTYSWSNGATTANISGLAAGTYVLTVTDFNGCTDIDSVVVTEPDVLVLTLDSVKDVSCNGGADGEIWVSTAGGTAPYTYLWNNAATTEDISGLTSGNYQLVVTDNNGCTDTLDVTVNEPSNPLALSTTQVNVLCFGDATGEIDLTVTGGTAPYSYLWSTGATTEDITGLLGDSTYTVTVTDANGCTQNTSVTITQPTELLAPITKANVFPCFGGRTGSASVAPVGGVAPYQVVWSNMPNDTFLVAGAGSHLNDSLFAGTYGVTIIDANGCIETNATNITQPTEVVAVATINANVTCQGDADGAATVSVTGGTAPYEYEWAHDTTAGASISGLGAGTYTVIVSDFYGCSDQVSVTITEPAALTASIVGTDVSCFGAADGAADLTVTGGTTPYTYNWGAQGSTQDLSGLSPGTYNVTVTDANGCTTTGSVTIAQPASAIALSSTKVNAACNGGSGGSIDLTVSGGTAPYSYSWNNGSTNQDLTGLTAGSYTVTVTDAKGCTANTTVVITEPAVLVATMNVSNISCNGNSDGAINLSVSGGTMPYSYSWSNGSTSEDLTGLAAGPYLVTVTDANGCSVTKSATVTSPAAIAVSASVVDVTCNGGVDGSIDLTIVGGTAPYTFNWGHGATTEDVAGLGAGLYSVVITDANGCSVTRNYTVSEFDPLVVQIVTTNVDCFGEANGTAYVEVSGGSGNYSYIWSNGAASAFITGLTAGNYTVTVTDDAGCSATTTETVGSPAPLTLSIDESHETAVGACNGEADLTVTGGTSPYAYQWSNGATIQDLTGLCPGTYTVTVTDAKGCQTTTSVTIDAFVGIEEASILSDVKVYPNPTVGLTFVEFNTTEAMDVTVVVTDMTGAYLAVKEFKSVYGQIKHEVDMSSFAKGVYLVNIQSAEGMITERIAVQ